MGAEEECHPPHLRYPRFTLSPSPPALDLPTSTRPAAGERANAARQKSAATSAGLLPRCGDDTRSAGFGGEGVRRRDEGVARRARIVRFPPHPGPLPHSETGGSRQPAVGERETPATTGRAIMVPNSIGERAGVRRRTDRSVRQRWPAPRMENEHRTSNIQRSTATARSSTFNVGRSTFPARRGGRLDRG
jgi:hypothetical protein